MQKLWYISYLLLVTIILIFFDTDLEGKIITTKKINIFCLIGQKISGPISMSKNVIFSIPVLSFPLLCMISDLCHFISNSQIVCEFKHT